MCNPRGVIMIFNFVRFLVLVFLSIGVKEGWAEAAVYSSAGGMSRPTICLNMIVKDEKEVICRCLESALPLIDYWVIVDTGSKDGTQDIIREYMKDVPGELYERPWVNFEHNRNEALDLAKDKADYLLFIDADDRFEIDPDFVMPSLDKEGYYMMIKYGGSLYPRVQLIKTSANWRWGGVVHEALIPPNWNALGKLEGVRMIIVGGGGRSQDPKKFLRDAELLEAALEKDPSSGRNVFYLAQSYKDAGEYQKSLENYERRVAMGGWDQEVFWSLYEIGLLKELLEAPEGEIADAYYKAYRYMPSRAEPLYRLCYYYRRKQNYLLGYLVGQFAHEIPVPKDYIFLEAWVYDYALLLEYSICAYWVEDYEEAYHTSLMLLAKPDLPDNVRECVERNLVFVVKHMPEGQSWGYRRKHA